MAHLAKAPEQNWFYPTLMLAGVTLLASSTMGALDGGYFVREWAWGALCLATLALIASVAGTLGGAGSRWGIAALGLLAAYAAWTFASLLWSPNRGDAWLGAGQTLLYLLAFWLAVGLVSLGASRRWVLAASILGPTLVAVFTLLTLGFTSIDENFLYAENLFGSHRLHGTVGYSQGEAAFLLVPFWGAVYLAGSPRVNPILRGLLLAGTVLGVSLAVLTQSRGATVAMAISLPVFFLISGQRVRGLFALAPIALALWVTFPDLNEVYVASVNQELGFTDQEPAPAVLLRVLPTVWLSAAGTGLYGILWGLIDRRWRPPSSIKRLTGGVVLAGGIVAVLVFGATATSERANNPVSWVEQRWETLINNNENNNENNNYTTERREESRLLSASGVEDRYMLWQVAWEDFAS